jgi:hypothetical protein
MIFDAVMQRFTSCSARAETDQAHCYPESEEEEYLYAESPNA